MMTGIKRFITIKAMILLLTGAISSAVVDTDWLVTLNKEPVQIEQRFDGREIILSNGLISRTFRLRPDVAAVAYGAHLAQNFGSCVQA